MDGDVSFGRWLTQRRKTLRLSRAELARRVCCAAITLRKLEEDARRPSPQIAAKLAEHLAIPPPDRATFIQVARGERRVEWLPSPDQPGAGALPLAPSARPGNVPSPLAPLIGRAADLAAVCELLRGGVRLLTLIGAPGIGKTRLSLQAAAELRGAPSAHSASSGQTFADGVYVIPLAPLSDSGLVLATIARALGVTESAGVPLPDRLAAYLRERQLLLVLDNFEHVLEAAPELAALLAAAPRLTLLVTSRVALRLVGEQRYPVPPLAFPPADGRWDGVGGPAPALAQYAAVELFVQRARAVLPSFALSTENALAVAAVCRRLDGLPLAIELAATRIALFTPQELLARLDRRLALLTAGALDMPVRQQTLRRAIDWSYDLLDAAEQTLLRRLGVFVGGCTLAAAAAVLSFELRVLNEDQCNSKLKTQNSELDVLDGLASLVDKSLLWRENGSDGRSRFVMLETIREYALERLEASGEAETLRRRHAAFYLALAEAAEPQLSTSDQLVWLDRLAQDHDNLRAALAWSLRAESAAPGPLSAAEGREPPTKPTVQSLQPTTDDGQPTTDDGERTELGLRLAGALVGFWDTRGHHSEGRQWLARALAVAGGPALPANAAARAKALHGAGMLAHVQEDNARAEALFTEGLALARTLDDSSLVALLLNDLGEQALHRGDTERAATLCVEGLALARAAGDRRAVVRLLYGLGDVARARGDLRSAEACYEEGLALCRALDDRRGSAWALHALAHLALAQGDLRRGAEALAEGLALARSIGDRENTAWLLYHTGLLMLKRHDLAGATAQFAESARLLHALGAGQGVALSLVGLAAVMIERQNPAQAARLLSVAEAQHWAGSSSWWVEADRATYEGTLATVRAQLDAAAFATAWAAGRTLTLERAIGEALDH